MRGAYWKHTFLDRPNSPGLPLLGAEQALLENRCNSQAVWGVSLHSSVLGSWALSKMEQGQGPQSSTSFTLRPSLHAQGSSLKMLHLLISLPRTWYWTSPLLPEKRFQGDNIHPQASFSLFMFIGLGGKMPPVEPRTQFPQYFQLLRSVQGVVPKFSGDWCIYLAPPICLLKNNLVLYCSK